MMPGVLIVSGHNRLQTERWDWRCGQ